MIDFKELLLVRIIPSIILLISSTGVITGFFWLRDKSWQTEKDSQSLVLSFLKIIIVFLFPFSWMFFAISILYLFYFVIEVLFFPFLLR